MTNPSHRRFVFALVSLVFLLLCVSSFAQNPDDQGAHYRELAASNRGLAADFRNRAQSWRDMAQKARERQSGSNSAAMKQILAEQVAQDEKEAAQAIAEADRLEQKAREFDQKAQAASGTGAVHGPTPPLGGSVANDGAGPNAGPAATPNAPGVAGKPNQSPSDSSACGCEPLPTWPKGKAPEVGAVRDEISNDYLESLFSNRAELYDGDWHKALLALAHDIDPKGELKISKGAAPAPTNPDFHVREGLLSDEFIHGVPGPGERRFNTTGPEEFASLLVHTLARTRRYGEPSTGLREHCLLLGHFIAEDLDKLQMENYAVRNSPGAKAIGGFAQRFRTAIENYASGASPQQHAWWGNHIPQEFAYPNEKRALDEYDIADAALDVVLFHDVSGKDVGLSMPPSDLYGANLAYHLLLTASGQAEFQPPGAKVDPRQEATGCKAFNALVILANPGRPDSAIFRKQILEKFSTSMYGEQNIVPNINPMALVSRKLLATDGPGSADEASATADGLFQYGRNCFENCKYTQRHRLIEGNTVIELLVALAQAGPSNPYASTISDYVKGKADEIQKELKALLPLDNECHRQLLAQLTAESTLAGAGARKLCAPPTCDFTIDSLPPEQVKVDLESHPGLAVVRKRDFPWPADSLARNEAFFVEVRLSYDDAAAQGKSLSVKIEVPTTGKSKEIVLSGAPHHGPTVYSTDAPIVFTRPFDLAGPSDLIKGQWESVNLEDLKLKNGDLVKVSFKDASTTFRFYESWVQQKIAKNDDDFIDLSAACETRLATSQDAGEGLELQKRIKMIAHARTIINDYHPVASDDQLTDLDRCFIGDAYHRLLREGPPGPDNRDEHGRKNWASGPSDSKRFGLQFVNDAESNAVASGILERKQYIKENLFKIPLAFSLASYHIMTQLSGANQMWTAVFGIDEDGNPVDLTGRIFAGAGAASGALFSVAMSRYLTDLSPSAKARARATIADEVVDEPTEADYKINPETAETIRENIEGKAKAPADVAKEPNLDLAREAYGPNASFRTPNPARAAVLQIGDRNCLFAVARAQILEGTGSKVPEVALREAAALKGLTRAGKGSSRGGYVYLIGRSGGKASKLEGGLKALKQLVDADYYVLVVVKTKLGGEHAVDFRGFVKGATTDYALFADPYFGREVMLPVCDFRDVFVRDAKLGWGKIAIADFGQAKPLK